jgi:hypothetical protein
LRAIGGRSSAYAAMPRTNRIGITIGGTRYFMDLALRKGLSSPAPIASSGAQASRERITTRLRGLPPQGRGSRAGSLWRLADRTAVLLSMLLLSPQMTPLSPVISLAAARLGIGSLSRAAELFCAGTHNCRIRFVGSRECSPAAFLDECAPVPRWGLVERDELCR